MTGVRTVSIDGRDIARVKAQIDSGKAPEPEADAYGNPAVRVLAHALVWVPLLIVLWIAYVSGTWIGGVGGGVLSVVSTVATVGVIWVWNRARRRRR